MWPLTSQDRISYVIPFTMSNKSQSWLPHSGHVCNNTKNSTWVPKHCALLWISMQPLLITGPAYRIKFTSMASKTKLKGELCYTWASIDTDFCQGASNMQFNGTEIAQREEREIEREREDRYQVQWHKSASSIMGDTLHTLHSTYMCSPCDHICWKVVQPSSIVWL